MYCSAVAVYLYMVPIGEMFAVPDNRIAAEAASRALGPAGAAFIAVAILISTFGCVNGLTLAGPRVVYAMARDGVFFRSMAEIHPRFRTPARALVLHGVVAAVLTLTGTYSDLLTLTAFSSLLFNVLTVIGLFVLRRTQPTLHRPYRALGYPVLPALYVVGLGVLPRLHPDRRPAEFRPRPGADRCWACRPTSTGRAASRRKSRAALT